MRAEPLSTDELTEIERQWTHEVRVVYQLQPALPNRGPITLPATLDKLGGYQVRRLIDEVRRLRGILDAQVPGWDEDEGAPAMSEPLTDAELDELEAFWTSGPRVVSYKGPAQDMLRLIAEVRRLRGMQLEDVLRTSLVPDSRVPPGVAIVNGVAYRLGGESRDTGEESEP